MDQDAWFTELYEAHHDAVLRYAARRTSPQAARDVAAETFAVAWRRREDIPSDPAATQPWLYGVARLVLANTNRSRQRAEKLAIRLVETFGPTQQNDDHADSVAERACLIQALDRLSPRDQEILRLIAWEELDLAQVAIALGCSRSAVGVRLYRARHRMVQALKAIDHSGAAMNIAGASTKVAEEMR